MSFDEDGISVVRWAEAVRFLTGLLPHVGADEVQIYQDVMMLVSKELLETGESIINGSGKEGLV